MIDFDYLRSEYAKCYSDKSRIYMIEHYLSTFDGTQGKDVPFLLFPKQKDLMNAMHESKKVVVTKPRQQGVTTCASGKIACEVCLTDPSSPITVLCIGNTLDLAQQFLFKVRDFLLQFPLWMWGDEFFNLGYDVMKAPENKNIIFDVCNGKEIKVKNGCRIVARSSGPNASRGVGGVNYLVFDECAFIDNSVQIYSAALPCIATTDGSVFLISTPNGKDPLYYETFRRAKLRGTPDWNGFTAVEMRWFQDPRYNRFLKWTRKNETTGEVDVIEEPVIDNEGNVRYDEQRWDTLFNEGWKPTSPWYIKMCQQFNHDEQKIAQELDVSFLGSVPNVVNPEYIEYQRENNVKDPVYQDQLEEDTWIWEEPIPGHRYILSVDNSRGDSADRTAIEIIDVDAVDENGLPCFDQVLEYNGKRVGDEIGEMANDYGRRYGNAYIVVEDIGGQGSATLLTLMRLEYPNLYYDDPSLKTFTMQREATTMTATTDGKLPGFHSSSVRYQMLSNFAGLVRSNQFKVRSIRMANELDTWVFKNGRQDHMDGCHDDTITCAAMGLFVYQFNMNKLEAAKSRDKTFLQAMVAANSTTSTRQVNPNIILDPQKMKRGDYGIDPFSLFGVSPSQQIRTKNNIMSDPKKAALMWVVR